MKLPVRVGLRVGIDGPACTLTAYFRFRSCPRKGDKIFLLIPTQGQVGFIVTEVCHFVSADEDPIILILCAPLIFNHYDAMLAALDWFKATYVVENFDADAEPELYYKFYRNLIHVLGLTKVVQPLVGYDPTDIKLFAEACRAVLLAELRPAETELSTAIQGFNPAIQHLHELVLDHRKAEPDGANMLAVVKTWEQLFNPKKLMQWTASTEDCIAYARIVFERLPSITNLPNTLRS